MNINTLKTVLGYLKTRLSRTGKAATIEQVFNYLVINDHLATSGQPSRQQFSLIQQHGYTIIINLAPSQAENAIENEAALVSQLGMEYIHIPVDFKNPTRQDFNRFAATLRQVSNHNVWLHCAANMRVSAFLYKYRRDVLAEDEASARRDLEKIWQPDGVWKRFLSDEELDSV